MTSSITILVIAAILSMVVVSLPNIQYSQAQGIDCKKLPFSKECIHTLPFDVIKAGPGPWPDHDCTMCGHIAFSHILDDHFWIVIGSGADPRIAGPGPPNPWIILHPGPRGFMMSSLPLSNGTVLVQTMSTTPLLNSTAMNQSSAK